MKSRFLLSVFAVVAFSLSLNAATRTEDVVYGRKFGLALTMDVFQPDQPNGAAIIYVISSDGMSSHDWIKPAEYAAFLERGYTVFTPVHSSPPKFFVSELIPDLHRAVRYVRAHAARFRVDPNRIGVMGISSGGTAALLMGTRGGAGNPDAKDPVARESSVTQAVACFCPTTDFLNFGAPGVDAVGIGPLAHYKPALGPQSDTAEGRQKLGREISPIYHIKPEMPPTLIIHGSEDKGMPIQQAHLFIERANTAGAPAKLVVKEGVGHKWDQTSDFGLVADWFDQHLRGRDPKASYSR